MSVLDTLDVGQASELKLAFRRTGWSNEEVKRICEGDILRDFRDVLLGRAIIQVIEHPIDCDAKPFEPDGLTVAPELEQLQNRVHGQFVLKHANIRLHLSQNQQNGKTINGIELFRELASQPVLPANVLDYYLAHPELIPAEWKGKYVYFWGTMYRGSGDNRYVRCLYFRESRWRWGSYWFDRDWDGLEPAAVPAN